MACIAFKGRPSEVLHTYQVWRIGSDPEDKSLDYCVADKSVAKYHASLTRCDKGLYLVNESRNRRVSVNGQLIGGTALITFRDAINGFVHLQFGRVKGYLRVSGTLGKADPDCSIL